MCLLWQRAVPRVCHAVAPLCHVTFVHSNQLRTLLDIIRRTQPHYIRCLKPNFACVPSVLERVGLVAQLRSGGVLEAVRVSRLGYPTRLSHRQFLQRYKCLFPAKLLHLANVPSRDNCNKLLAALLLPPEHYQVGITKVFFRKGACLVTPVCHKQQLG